MILEDVLFKDFEGTTSKKFDPKVGEMICSAPGVSFMLTCDLQRPCLWLTFDPKTCTNVRAENVRINTPSGKTPRWSTRYLDRSLLDVNGDFVDG